ncbi:MAG: DUF4179 domain-containing protein [Lachnospiraceae bacterium]|nr:DUF4179 domain-containing protein [Lachnospiraceae bacterium]
MDQNTINQLKVEVEIPEIVLKSADAAFAKIYQEVESGTVIADVSFSKESGQHHKVAKRFAACIAVGMLAFSAITAGAAAYFHWSKGLERQFQVSEEQKPQMEESGLVDFPDLSVVDEGVTVTLEQSIVDDYFAYLSFKVEGYDVPDGEQPEFKGTIIRVGEEGEEDKVDMAGGYFYNGLVIGLDGKYKMPDGSAIPEDEDGNYVLCYDLGDGSLEYHIMLSATNDKGYFLDNPIHIELSDLGTYSDKSGDVEADVRGKWVFDWTLTGSDEIRKAKCNEVLGDTGAAVVNAEISPVSICVEFDFAYQETLEPAIDETKGIEYEAVTYAEPPELFGVRLKDGTIYPYLMGGGTTGYMDEEHTRFQMILNTNRILDVDQVESLLFLKSYPETGDSITEDNLYEIKLH